MHRRVAVKALGIIVLSSCNLAFVNKNKKELMKAVVVVVVAKRKMTWPSLIIITIALLLYYYITRVCCEISSQVQNTNERDKERRNIFHDTYKFSRERERDCTISL
jgi:chromate transport protein ChrA